jgi:hypothetical protein
MSTILAVRAASAAGTDPKLPDATDRFRAVKHAHFSDVAQAPCSILVIES